MQPPDAESPALLQVAEGFKHSREVQREQLSKNQLKKARKRLSKLYQKALCPKDATDNSSAFISSPATPEHAFGTSLTGAASEFTEQSVMKVATIELAQDQSNDVQGAAGGSEKASQDGRACVQNDQLHGGDGAVTCGHDLSISCTDMTATAMIESTQQVQDKVQGKQEIVHKTVNPTQSLHAMKSSFHAKLQASRLALVKTHAKAITAPAGEPRAVCHVDMSSVVQMLASKQRPSTQQTGGVQTEEHRHPAQDCSTISGQPDGLQHHHQQQQQQPTGGNPVDMRKPAKGGGKQRRECIYGNYHGYYGYRHASLEAFDDDPRLSLFQPEWFAGRHMLDVGCNEGLVTLAVAMKYGCASTTGVDIDKGLIGKASRNLRGLRSSIAEQVKKGQPQEPTVTMSETVGPAAERSNSKRRRRFQGNPAVSESVSQGLDTVMTCAASVHAEGRLQGLQETVELNVDVEVVATLEAGPVDAAVCRNESGLVQEMNEAGQHASQVPIVLHPPGSHDGQGRARKRPVYDACIAADATQQEHRHVQEQHPKDEIEPEEQQKVNVPSYEHQGDGQQQESLQHANPHQHLHATDKRGRQHGPGNFAQPVKANSKAEKWAALRTAAKALGSVQFFHQDWANQDQPTVHQEHTARGGESSGREGGKKLPRPRRNFDVIMCLSVSKWIHLNWGDHGLLRLFIKFNSHLTEGGYLILEPQPWKSYQTALTKKHTKGVTVQDLSQLQVRPANFVQLLTHMLGFELLADLNKSYTAAGFDRPMYVFRKVKHIHNIPIIASKAAEAGTTKQQIIPEVVLSTWHEIKGALPETKIPVLQITTAVPADQDVGGSAIETMQGGSKHHAQHAAAAGALQASSCAGVAGSSKASGSSRKRSRSAGSSLGPQRSHRKQLGPHELLTLSTEAGNDAVVD